MQAKFGKEVHRVPYPKKKEMEALQKTLLELQVSMGKTAQQIITAHRKELLEP
jgi:hypothetical protein